MRHAWLTMVVVCLLAAGTTRSRADAGPRTGRRTSRRTSRRTGRRTASRSSRKNRVRKAGGKKRTALKLVNQAQKLMAAGHYAGAVLRLRRAFALHRIYVMPMMMGLCHQRMDQMAKARADFLLARRVGAGRMPARHRRLVAAHLKQIALRFRFDKVMVRTTRPGVVLFVDTVKVGTTPLKVPLVVAIGRHVLEGRLGRFAGRLMLVVEGGGSKTVTLRLHRVHSVHSMGRHGGSHHGPGHNGSTKSGVAGTDGAVGGSGTDETSASRAATSTGSISIRRKTRPSRAREITAWSGIGLAGVGTALLIPGITLLAIDGNDAGSGHDGVYLRKKYDTRGPGIGLTVAGGVLILAGAVTYGLSYVFKGRSKKAADGIGPSDSTSAGVRFGGNTSRQVSGAQGHDSDRMDGSIRRSVRAGRSDRRSISWMPVVGPSAAGGFVIGAVGTF